MAGDEDDAEAGEEDDFEDEQVYDEDKYVNMSDVEEPPSEAPSEEDEDDTLGCDGVAHVHQAIDFVPLLQHDLLDAVVGGGEPTVWSEECDDGHNAEKVLRIAAGELITFGCVALV